MYRCSTFIAFVITVLFLPPAAIAQKNVGASEKKLLTVEEYSALLDRIDRDLVMWKAKLDAIDPGKGNPSYDVGKQIEVEKLIVLGAISNAKAAIFRLRAKKTVYQELVLADSVDDISFFFAQLDSIGAFNGVSMPATNKDAAELSVVQTLIKNDGMERLRLLESRSCSDSNKPQ